MTYGYVRVSTRDQNEARQIDAMHDFGVDKILIDKQSGKDFLRPSYQKMIRRLKSGDVIVIKSIDRLGRNYTDILEQWRVITKEIGADIVVLDMPLLDTRKGRDLTGTFIADLVLQILSYVAETERAFIRKRQAEGIAAAKARGVVFGPKKRDLGTLYPELRDRFLDGDISASKAGTLLGCTHNTFIKRVKQDMAVMQIKTLRYDKHVCRWVANYE